jgi:hypothetical protein
MANNVLLYQRPNRSFELEINSLIVKTDFTSNGFPAVLTEIDSYLVSAEGQARLSGTFNDLGDFSISWITPSPSPSAFDGTYGYRINFVKQTN